MSIHPAIKLINLIIVLLFITFGGWDTTILTGAIVLPFYLFKPQMCSTALSMLMRLKWFLLSILIIYAYFTPLPETASYLHQSSIENISRSLLPGLYRVTVLIVIILAVNLLIRSTSQEQLLAALLWNFSPLNKLGINIDRFFLRAVLTMEAIGQLDKRLLAHKKKLSARHANKRSGFFRLIAEFDIILHENLNEVSNLSGKVYKIKMLTRPHVKQWSLPAILTCCYVLAVLYL